MTHREELHQHSDVDSDWAPWGKCTAEQSEAAAARCEIRVTLTKTHHSALRSLLMYDRRKKGACGGRGLTANYPPLLLLAGDRLEPCAELSDVGRFEDLQVPCTVLFWRKSNETRLRHRCPLLDSSIGMSVERIQIDMLHCVYLGTASEWLTRCIWFLLLNDVYNIGDHRTDDETVAVGLDRFRAELFRWYADKRPTAASDFTPLEDLVIGMIGTKDKQAFSTKAAECKTLCPFMLLTLEKYAAKLGEPVGDLISAGRSLMNFIQVVKDAPDVPDAASCKVCLCIFWRRRF